MVFVPATNVPYVEKVKLGMCGRWEDETKLKLVALQRNRKVVFC